MSITIKCIRAYGNKPKQAYLRPVVETFPLTDMVRKISQCCELVELVDAQGSQYFNSYVIDADQFDEFSVTLKDDHFVVEGLIYGGVSLYKRVVITHKNEIGYPVIRGEVFEV